MAGHHQPQRVAVEHRQVGAVHLPGQHHFAVHGVVEIEGLDEIRAVAQRRHIQAVEGHLHRAGFQAGLLQQLFQGDAGPARVAHGAMRQLAAIGARREMATAIAGALVDGHQFDRVAQLADLVQRQFQRRIDVAAHFQPIALRIDGSRDAAPVVAHKEGVVRRDLAVVKHAERRFQLRRTGGQQYQWALLWIGHQFALAVFEGQYQARCVGRQRRQRGGGTQGRRAQRAGLLEESAPLQRAWC